MIGEVLSTEATTEGASHVLDVKVDPGGGTIITVQHFGAPGDDSVPLPLDAAVLVDTPGTGRKAAVGYVDPLNASEASPGERRLYARSPVGVVMCRIHLKGDGTVQIANAAGSFEMAPAGDVTINGVVIGVDGSVSAPGEVTAMASAVPVNLSTHIHSTGVGPSGTPQG